MLHSFYKMKYEFKGGINEPWERLPKPFYFHKLRKEHPLDNVDWNEIQKILVLTTKHNALGDNCLCRGTGDFLKEIQGKEVEVLTNRPDLWSRHDPNVERIMLDPDLSKKGDVKSMWSERGTYNHLRNVLSKQDGVFVLDMAQGGFSKSKAFRSRAREKSYYMSSILVDETVHPGSLKPDTVLGEFRGGSESEPTEIKAGEHTPVNVYLQRMRVLKGMGVKSPFKRPYLTIDRSLIGERSKELSERSEADSARGLTKLDLSEEAQKHTRDDRFHVFVNPYANSFRGQKQPSTEKYVETIRRLAGLGEIDVFLEGGNTVETLNHMNRVFNQLDLDNVFKFPYTNGNIIPVSHLVAMTSLMHCVVSVDSGPAHVAAGLNKPVVITHRRPRTLRQWHPPFQDSFGINNPGNRNPGGEVDGIVKTVGLLMDRWRDARLGRGGKRKITEWDQKRLSDEGYTPDEFGHNPSPRILTV